MEERGQLHDWAAVAIEQSRYGHFGGGKNQYTDNYNKTVVS